jgi:superfamily II DNA or RNA helicase
MMTIYTHVEITQPTTSIWRLLPIPQILRKSSPYIEVNKFDPSLVERLSQVAEVLTTPPESEKMLLKFELKKAAKHSLQDILRLLAQAGYGLSPGLQKDILKLQGVSQFAELYLRKSDLILKPTGFIEITDIKSLLTYNAKERVFHARIMDFFTVRNFLENKGYQVVSHLTLEFSLPAELKAELHLDMVLRDYQQEALRRWFGAKKRGVIVLPTGSGKTIIALEAIRQLGVKTLIVVPTIDLLNQWSEVLKKQLHVPEVGMLGGGTKVVAPITVSTYDSASLMAPKIAEKFGLIVFDEVHHLPSPSYRLSAELLIAPNRLGLTATPERYDELHLELDRLVGPTIYRVAPKILEREGHLAPYSIKTIQISLTDEEKVRYESYMSIFRKYTRQLSEIEPDWDFETIVARTLFDPDARSALSHLEKARRVALDASGKLDHLEKLLSKYRDSKVIIFSRYTRIVEKISDIFGIPLITHKTKTSERTHILTGFRQGHYTKIATGQVLDEGIDVPDASVGIIISGTGSKREFIQRLGRLLRPEKTEAILYELVTESTIEDGIAKRRHFRDDKTTSA